MDTARREAIVPRFGRLNSLDEWERAQHRAVVECLENCKLKARMDGKELEREVARQISQASGSDVRISRRGIMLLERGVPVDKARFYIARFTSGGGLESAIRLSKQL